MTTIVGTLAGALLLTGGAAAARAGAVEVRLLGEARAWRQAEFRADGVPGAKNPFDPDEVRLDATFVGPSGTRTTVPGFWHREFRRSLVEGAEVLQPVGEAHWRVRYLPTEAGPHRLTLAVNASGVESSPSIAATIRFDVTRASAAERQGIVRVAADARWFETSDGQRLPLIGANVCWAGPRGTHDFDDWLPAGAAAGWNLARLWLSPWSIGIEHEPGTLNRYDLEGAWQLDHVFELAERHGLYLLLSLDHHGMYMVDDPAWGGSNNFWRSHNPYSREQGGPCADPNEFFTSPEARALYRKRLRYLVARFGASPRLLAWQFFNEIDNAYVPRSTLRAADVAAWHAEMAHWLRASDPYRHLITTSLTGGSDRPELWSLPDLDFSIYHSYSEGAPARRLAQIGDELVRRYRKPALVGEFGISARAWNAALDPHLRGFRQGLWGGALGGWAGSSLTWWWQELHAESAYPLYAVLRHLTRRAGWEQGSWRPLSFIGDLDPPRDLGAPVENGEPFDVELALNVLRLNPVPGEIAVADRLAAERGMERVSSYLHAAQKSPPLQHAMRITAWFAERGRLLLRVNSVAADATLVVSVDGAAALRAPLVNTDGKAIVNREIDRELAVVIPPGKHRIEITHDGRDWVHLDSVRLERVRPATFAGGWSFPPEPIGSSNGRRALVYVSSPHVAWSAGAIRYNPPAVMGAALRIADWPRSRATADWFSPETGLSLGRTRGQATNGVLTLPLPPFRDDVVGILR